jgi:hypothetical protein
MHSVHHELFPDPGKTLAGCREADHDLTMSARRVWLDSRGEGQGKRQNSVMAHAACRDAVREPGSQVQNSAEMQKFLRARKSDAAACYAVSGRRG